MAKMLIIGNTLVSEKEFNEKSEKIEELIARASSGDQSSESLETANGVISVAAIREELSYTDPASGEELQYESIGIGKPMSVEILTMYSGDFRKKISIGKRELLLMSAIKTSATYEAKAKAINLLVKNGQENKYLDFSSFGEGTRVVFYTPAVDADSYDLSFNFLVDSFDQELVDKISSAIQVAGTIPVFLSYSTLLLAGSKLLSIAGVAGNKLLQKKPLLEESIRLQFGIGGLTNSVSRKMLICENYEEFSNYKIQRLDNFGKVSYKLVNITTNQAYQGDEPYLIINIDGRKRESLESFTPKLVTAAILEKFGQDEANNSVAILEDAMQLYNDYIYKTKADKLKKKLVSMGEGEEYDKQKAIYDAYIANIYNEVFKEN